MKRKLRCLDLEVAVAQRFNPRANLIVPNVSWGLFMHECDVLIVSRAGFATEIEIKVSKQDLIKDKEKSHGHKHSKISRLYFAIPSKLMPHIEHVPAHAGIIEVRHDLPAVIQRPAPLLNKYKFTPAEMFQVARLGTMRIWTLKKKLAEVPQ